MYIRSPTIELQIRTTLIWGIGNREWGSYYYRSKILTSCTNTSELVKAQILGYPQASFLLRGSPAIKKRQDGAPPTQLTCRGAPCGYPGSTVSTSIFKLVQDVKIEIDNKPTFPTSIVSIYKGIFHFRATASYSPTPPRESVLTSESQKHKLL